MKPLGSLLLIAAVAFGVFTLYNGHSQAAAREQMIAEHRVALAMTRDQVRRSLGEPAAVATTAAGHEVWGYGDGTIVTFAGNTMIDSHKEKLPAPAAKPAPAQSVTYLPGVGWVQHDSRVSAMQSIGGGSYGGPAATPPLSASQQTAQKMGLQGSALDQKAHR